MPNISSIIKNVRNIMRQDRGVSGDAQRLEQLGWMLFLKILDDKDQELELIRDRYQSVIPEKFQWRNWATDPEGTFRCREPPDEENAIVREGDFILSRANTKELAGNSVVVAGLTLNLLLSDKTIRFRIAENVSSFYANLVNKAAFVREHFIAHATGASPSMKNLSRDAITSHLFPLPPLAEQAAIVERVEALMEHCRTLAAEIEHTRTHAAHLLQAVLKEAFAPAA